MSIDLCAFFSFGRGNLSREQLIDELNAGCPNVKRLIADWVYPGWVLPRCRAGSTPPPIRWEFSDIKIGKLFDLEIPKGNSILSISPLLAEFWQGSRWECIWRSLEFQHLLRTACFDLAQVLGSDVAIYMPEVVSVEGDTLEDLIQNLQRERGSPAPTIDALQHADEPNLWEAKGCYYIDRFEDLRT